MIFTLDGVHSGCDIAWVKFIPLRAKESKIGVLYEVLPLILKHSKPISSAMIRITFGFEKSPFCEWQAMSMKNNGMIPFK